MKKFKNWLLFQYYRYLGRCARNYLRKHNVFTIGINGSVGKTSCRMIIHQTLQKALPEATIYTSPKNFNGELGMSLSIFQVEDWSPSIFNMIKVWFQTFWKMLFGKKPYDTIVLEYGIDRPKEMEFLLSINKPHIGVFTALDAVHSEQFWDPAAIANEEVKMIKNTREIAFLNAEDHYAQQLKNQISIELFMYQTEHKKPELEISFENETLRRDQGLISDFLLDIKWRKYQVKTNLFGKPNYGYLGVALVIADIVKYQQTGKGLDYEHFLSSPLIFQLQPWRCSLFEGKYESIIIDSTYNASPLSMRKLIDTTLQVQKSLSEKRKVMLVLWDMRELGDLTQQEHRLLAGYVHQSSDQLILLGNYMREYLADELTKIWYPEEKLQVVDSISKVEKAISKILKNTDEKWIILFKGSQNTIFLEEAVKRFLKRSEDIQHLTRQSDWWVKKKNNIA